jgi:hypothetical protein
MFLVRNSSKKIERKVSVMSVPSFYHCEFGDRFVNVWPADTGESGFYDVCFGPMDGDEVYCGTWSWRMTAREAAAIVITELGAPLATTLDALEGMIVRWRAELDDMVREPVR